MARKLSKGRKRLILVPKTAAPTAEKATSIAILTGATAYEASDDALADGFALAFGEPEKVDGTPIGSSRTTFVTGEGELNASINWDRNSEKAWDFHEEPGVEFWGVLREGVHLSKVPLVAETQLVNVFDLVTTEPTPRQDAEIDSFNVTYGQGSNHLRNVPLTA